MIVIVQNDQIFAINPRLFANHFGLMMFSTPAHVHNYWAPFIHSTEQSLRSQVPNFQGMLSKGNGQIGTIKMVFYEFNFAFL